jgi:hypothetical protein
MTEGYEVYAEFIEKLVDAESARRTTLEQKAGAVITTSGTLVTLLFGLVAVLTTKQSFKLPSAAQGWLVGAAFLFAFAAVIALLIGVPRPYGEADLTIDELAGMWSDPISDARAAVAGLRLQALETGRLRNTAKARMLITAMGIEVVAVIALAIAVAIMLNSSQPT